MRKRLLNLLATLSYAQLTRLRDFIAQHYTKDENTIMDLLDALLPLLKNNENDLLLRVRLFQQVWKTLRINQESLKKMWNIAQKFVQTDQPEKMVGNVLRGVKAPMLDQLFQLQFQLAQKLQAATGKTAAKNYYYQFLQASEIELRQQLLTQRKSSEVELLQMIDAFYAANLLRYALGAKAEKRPLLEEVLKLCRKGQYDYSASVQMYFLLYRLLHKKEEDAYHLLRDKLSTDRGKLPAFILRDGYVWAINYCVAQLNRGQFSYMRELFVLYTAALDLQLEFENYELLSVDYRGLKSLGSRLADYNWVEKFVDLYLGYAPAVNQVNVVSYNLAQVSFNAGKYQEVVRLLANAQYDDFYWVEAHVLLAKAHFELQQYDKIAPLAKRMKTRLRRKTIAPKRADATFFMHCLQQLSTPLSKLELRALRKEIADRKNCKERAYLLQKVGK